MGTTIPIRNQKDIETIKKYYLEKKQYRNYALFVVGINTALRISDLLSLEWRDVFDSSNHVWVKYIDVTEWKTGKQNTIFLNRNAREALEMYRSRSGAVKSGDKIFCNNRDRKQAITRTQAYAVIRRACLANGIEGKIRCHSLRKTFGYHAWKRNVPEVMLMNIFNHSSFAITTWNYGIRENRWRRRYEDIYGIDPADAQAWIGDSGTLPGSGILEWMVSVISVFKFQRLG